MKQKHLSMFICFLLVTIFLSACQENPSREIVTSKNDGAFENILATPSLQDPVSSDFILTKNGEFLSTDKSVTFTWNINQSIGLSAMPVVKVVPKFLNGKDAERIAAALFGENVSFYDLGPVTERRLSKSEILKKIQVLSQYTTEDKLSELMGEEANLENVKYWLEHFLIEFETAPEESQREKCDWELKERRYYEDNDTSKDSKSKCLLATTSVNGYDYLLRTYVRKQNDYLENSIFVTLGDGNDPTYVQKTVDIVKMCHTDKPTNDQITSTKAKAEDILKKIGLGDFRIAEVIVEDQLFGEIETYQIKIEAVPVFEGKAALYGDYGRSYIAEKSYNSDYSVGKVQLFFSANGELVSCGITNPVEVESVINKNVTMLSIEEIIDKAQAHMALYDSRSMDRFTANALMLEVLTGRTIDTMDCKVEITGIEYGLGRFPIADSVGFYYAPAVAFEGTIDYCDRETGEIVTGTGNPYGTRLQSLVVINAVDGTIY